MGTRTNFYKNPSYAYDKDLNLNSALQNLRAYNVATGNTPPINDPSPDESKILHRKRRRECLPPPGRSCEIDEKDGPMSHQDYIDKRRREINASQPYTELDADVLESSCSGLLLVDYVGDTSTSSGSEQELNPLKSSLLPDISCGKQYPESGSTDEVDRVKTRNEQRFPVPGEPVCVVCGKYGEYICNETDDDICSMDCKSELLRKLDPPERQINCQNPVDFSRGPEKVPKFGGDTWDYNRHCWSKKRSTLSTYECWKCRRPGHLSEDCLVVIPNHPPSSGEKCNEFAVKQTNYNISRDLLQLYRRCHQIGENLSSARCNLCCRLSTLAVCLSCSNSFCDSAGHLSKHINTHPSHRRYYSCKLKRLVKCCKSTCNVTDIKDLLACHYCFDKAFDKFYDMCTATWKPAGLSVIWGSICCDDHFTWHRINCLNANVEDSAYIIRKHENRAQLSDFIF